VLPRYPLPVSRFLRSLTSMVIASRTGRG